LKEDGTSEFKYSYFGEEIIPQDPVQTITSIPWLSLFILAKAGGDIEVRDWPGCEVVNKLEIRGSKLKNLTLSPDGCFMGIVMKDGTFSVWDLRVIAIPLFYARALASEGILLLRGV
jgi:hypothetical protein